MLAGDDRTLAEQELEAPAAEVDAEQLRAALRDGLGEADVVGHRIVHGGERFHTAVVVDDGIATGFTARAAVAVMRHRDAARVVLGVPVGPPGAVAALGEVADEVVCVEITERFFGISQWYSDFRQVGDDEVASLLALILLTDSRRGARISTEGEFLRLADQDRSKWHRDSIDEGLALVGVSIRRGRPGRFTLMAAIAAVHSSAAHWDETDWAEIVGLYDLLLATWPSPVVALNRAVALSFAQGPMAGLAAIDALSTEPQLSTYPYLAAARGDCLERLDRFAEAREAFEEAALLTENHVERDFLRSRIVQLS